ncbi:MAG: DNA alkylation repair protein, partial [Turicibacter sp.]|nr:DNA alkylation repair protein [Turicibacter sp.]
VIGYIKDASVFEIMQYIKNFVPKIDNWSVCDSFCSGLKITKKHQQQFWPMITSYLSSDNEFEVRFGIVMMLNYYVDNKYVVDTLNHLEQVNHSGYYVRIAIAWAISVCYVQYPNLTLSYLKESQLDTFTYNKALQKICESLKSDQKTKELMKQLKR